MASVAQYLVTLHFIDEFDLVVAQALTVPEEHHNILWQAEVAGYESVLEDLRREAQDFEAEHIRIHENEDDGYFTALMDVLPGVTGIGSSPEAARTSLRLSVEAYLGSTMEKNNELPQTGTE